MYMYFNRTELRGQGGQSRMSNVDLEKRVGRDLRADSVGECAAQKLGDVRQNMS
jgi:hypothetical protein